MAFHLGVDVGERFPDRMVIRDAGHIFHAKSLTTRADLMDGMLGGIADLAEDTRQHLGICSASGTFLARYDDRSRFRCREKRGLRSD